jgi:hypothetical protein
VDTTATFPQVGIYILRLTVNDGYGSRYDDTVINVGAVSDQNTWAAIYAPANLSDPAADFDGDGRSNREEQIWGLDPTSAASANPYASPFNANGGTFSYTRRNPAFTGISYTIRGHRSGADTRHPGCQRRANRHRDHQPRTHGRTNPLRPGAREVEYDHPCKNP